MRDGFLSDADTRNMIWSLVLVVIFIVGLFVGQLTDCYDHIVELSVCKELVTECLDD